MNSTPALKINLLAKKKVVFDRQAALALKVKVISGIVLIAYVLMVFGVMSVSVIFRARLNATEKAVNAAKMSLAGNAMVINQFTSLVQNVKSVQAILNQRRETMRLWQQLQPMIPAGCTLASFALDGDNLQISIEAPHVLLANQVVDMVQQNIDDLGVKKTTVAISRMEDASYLLAMTVALKPESARNEP